jgi:hypothetical protein
MVSTKWKGEKGESEIGSRMGGGVAGGWFAGFIAGSSISAPMWARGATHGRMEEKLMPDFNTRKPREPNEPNKHRIPVIASNLRNLLSVSKLRNLLVANRPRAFLIGGGILLFGVVLISVGLLILSYNLGCTSTLTSQIPSCRRGPWFVT